jgi:hypothetical protein
MAFAYTLMQRLIWMKKNLWKEVYIALCFNCSCVKNVLLNIYWCVFFVLLDMTIHNLVPVVWQEFLLPSSYWFIICEKIIMLTTIACLLQVADLIGFEVPTARTVTSAVFCM